MRRNISCLSIALVCSLVTVANAYAEGAASTGGDSSAMAAIGAGLAIALAALGGTLSQGKAVSSALESIGRNPSAAGQLLTPMILGLALIESLVILSWVIANNLAGKV